MSVPWHGANKGRGRVLYGVHQIWAGFCAILAWLSTVRVRSLPHFAALSHVSSFGRTELLSFHHFHCMESMECLLADLPRDIRIW